MAADMAGEQAAVGVVAAAGSGADDEGDGLALVKGFGSGRRAERRERKYSRVTPDACGVAAPASAARVRSVRRKVLPTRKSAYCSARTRSTLVPSRSRSFCTDVGSDDGRASHKKWRPWAEARSMNCEK